MEPYTHYLPSSHQLMLLPTQLLWARGQVPCLLYSSEIQAPNIFETLCNIHRKFCFPSPTAPATRRGKYEFAWCQFAALSNAPTVPALSTAGAAGLVGRENPPRAFSEQGWISLLLWELLWDGERYTWRRAGQEPQLESTFLLSIGPFLGSCSGQVKENKENRSMNSSCLP